MFKKKHYYTIESNTILKDGKKMYYPIGHAFSALSDILLKIDCKIELSIVSRFARDDKMTICLKGKAQEVENFMNTFYCTFHKEYSISKESYWFL